MQNEMLTREEAAEYLGVTTGTMENWATREKGPRYYKPGRRVLYKKSDLDEYVEASVCNPSPKPEESILKRIKRKRLTSSPKKKVPRKKRAQA